MKPLQSTFFFLHSRVLALPRFAIEKCNLSNCSFPPPEALAAAAAAAAASRSSGRSFMCALQLHKPPDVHQVKRWGACSSQQAAASASDRIYLCPYSSVTLPINLSAFGPPWQRAESNVCFVFDPCVCVCSTQTQGACRNTVTRTQQRHRRRLTAVSGRQAAIQKRKEKQSTPSVGKPNRKSNNFIGSKFCAPTGRYMALTAACGLWMGIHKLPSAGKSVGSWPCSLRCCSSTVIVVSEGIGADGLFGRMHRNNSGTLHVFQK